MTDSKTRLATHQERFAAILALLTQEQRDTLEDEISRAYDRGYDVGYDHAREAWSGSSY